MRVSIIVAMDEGGGIGFENRLPWRLPRDLERFKQITMGHHLIVGRKTFQSIGRPLPGRQMILMTRASGMQFDGVDTVASLEAALELAQSRGEDEAFIGGGSEIYWLALPITDRIYLTRVHAQTNANVFFPEFDIKVWDEISKEEFGVDEKNRYPTTYTILEKGS